jgi:hypothetical protein
MQESKIELCSRLRREGKWREASKFKDAAIKRLRDEGKKRSEASDLGWEEMAKHFPPALPSANTIAELVALDTSVVADALAFAESIKDDVNTAIQREIEERLEKRYVLSPECRAALTKLVWEAAVYMGTGIKLGIVPEIQEEVCPA